MGKLKHYAMMGLSPCRIDSGCLVEILPTSLAVVGSVPSVIPFEKAKPACTGGLGEGLCEQTGHLPGPEIMLWG